MSKVIISGPRDFFDYEVVKQAIESSGFDITEIVHGDAKGVDKLGQRWAEENGIPFQKYPALWKDLTLPGAVPKENKYGVYNATAGHYRNGQMAEYADALIVIGANLGTSGTNHMLKLAKEKGLKIFEYNIGENEEDFEFSF